MDSLARPVSFCHEPQRMSGADNGAGRRFCHVELKPSVSVRGPPGGADAAAAGGRVRIIGIEGHRAAGVKTLEVVRAVAGIGIDGRDGTIQVAGGMAGAAEVRLVHKELRRGNEREELTRLEVFKTQTPACPATLCASRSKCFPGPQSMCSPLTRQTEHRPLPVADGASAWVASIFAGGGRWITTSTAGPAVTNAPAAYRSGSSGQPRPHLPLLPGSGGQYRLPQDRPKQAPVPPGLP
jgi:hypothetical protein